MPGITSVKVALLAERGIVEYDPTFVGPDGTGWHEAKVVEVSRSSPPSRRPSHPVKLWRPDITRLGDDLRHHRRSQT